MIPVCALFLLVDMFGHPVPEPYRLPGGWWTCPSGWWIRAGRCVPWHEGQDVEIVPEKNSGPVSRKSREGAP